MYELTICYCLPTPGVFVRLSLGAFGAPTKKYVNIYSNCMCLLDSVDRPLPPGFRLAKCHLFYTCVSIN